MAELLYDGPVALRRSPLAHLHDELRAGDVTGDRAVILRERPCTTMVSVRVTPGSPAADRIGTVVGGLPLRSGETTTAGAHTTVWLGPDEWLVVSDEEAALLVQQLRGALQGDSGSVVDVSANRTTLELTGPTARAVLEKGCPLDLHPRRFGPGVAVATTVGPVPVLLWQTDGSSYRLLPRSSFADYLARWLLDAMREFRAPEVP
jgi:heterotetrameric sarcosine oxidase gamma subunit